MKTNDTIRQWVNLIAVILTIIVNILANALPINGQATGEISDRFLVYFVPAGYVFAIWGLIYLGLIGFGIFQALPAQRENPRLRAIGYWFLLASLANISWIFFWHYNQFVWSLVAMIVLLLSLIVIFQRIGTGRFVVPLQEFWLVQVPFSIYLGWISVATIANVTDVLYDLNWNGFGIAPEVWAVVMLAVAVILGFLMAWRRADIPYLLVFIWSFVGIAIKQADTALVAYAAWAAAGITVLLVILAFQRRKKIFTSPA